MTEPSFIEQAITEHWGDRCPEYEPGCGACEAWEEYDAMTQQNQSPVVTDEELITALRDVVTCGCDEDKASQLSGLAATRLETLTFGSPTVTEDMVRVANREFLNNCQMPGSPTSEFHHVHFDWAMEAALKAALILHVNLEEFDFGAKQGLSHKPDQARVSHFESPRIEELVGQAKRRVPDDEPAPTDMGARYHEPERDPQHFTALSSGVRVKPLEWSENGVTSLWTGELAFGAYYTAYDEGNGWRVFRCQFLSEAGDDEIAYGTKPMVLAAAQADYERRILSALEGEGHE